MSAPSWERQRAVLAMLVELALRKYASDGLTPPADVAHVAAVVALGSPAMAATCPRLLATLPGDVRAAVVRLASGPPVTSAATAGPKLAHWLTVAQAAGVTGLTGHGIRARCRRGQVTATKHRVTGEWRIDPAGLAGRRRR